MYVHHPQSAYTFYVLNSHVEFLTLRTKYYDLKNVFHHPKYYDKQSENVFNLKPS